MRIKINHNTHYSYSHAVDYALQKLRLRPLGSPLQSVVDWSIEITGGKLETSYADHYGNHVDLVSIDPGAQSLAITVSGIVETHNTTGVLGQVYGKAPLWLFKQPTPLTTAGPLITSLAAVMDQNNDPLTELHALSDAILKAAPYMAGETHTRTTAEDALKGKLGVCQDHAQIFITAARLKGIPARYVSGYLVINDQIEQSATHAWAEAHVEGLGWVGFDVSNGVSPDEKYVRLAIGRDASEAAPIEGMRMGPSDETLIVSLQIQQ